MRKTLAIAVLALLGFQFTPYYSEDITSSSTSTSTEASFSSGSVVLSTVSGTARFTFSRDYMQGGNFEDSAYDNASFVSGPTKFIDECDLSGQTLNANGPWLANDVGETTTCAASTGLNGLGVLRITNAGTQLVLNDDMEAVAVDDFTNWTENVNAGTGTITSEETTIHGGLESAKLTGGTAHVDLTSDAITVTESTTYVLTVWGEIGAGGDLLDIRVVESTGGTKFLKSDGTWQAAEQDLCTATFQTGSFTQCVVQFTTEAGITGITISANVDVAGDIGYVDDWSLYALTTGSLSSYSTQRLKDTTTGAYNLCFEHKESQTGINVQYALIDPDVYADVISLTPYYYTGSAWSATETWIDVTNSTTKATVCDLFEGRGADVSGQMLKVVFRVQTFGDEGAVYADLDDIRVTKAATATSSLVSTTPMMYNIDAPTRVVVYGAGSVVNVSAVR